MDVRWLRDSSSLHSINVCVVVQFYKLDASIVAEYIRYVFWTKHASMHRFNSKLIGWEGEKAH